MSSYADIDADPETDILGESQGQENLKNIIDGFPKPFSASSTTLKKQF